MYENIECKIPLIDWGVKGRDIESYVAIAIQPNLQLSTKYPFREAILWKAIDKDLACECYCGESDEPKSWRAIRNNLNLLDKEYEELGSVVTMSTVEKGKIVGLKYKRMHEGDNGPHAYVSIPCDSVIDIMRACTSKIDFIVYLIILRKYLVDNQLKHITDTPKGGGYVMCLPKYIATQVSYYPRNISDAVTRLKNVGLIQIEDEYVYYEGSNCTYHKRNLKIRNLEEWDILRKSNYNFALEKNKRKSHATSNADDLIKDAGVSLIPKNKHQLSMSEVNSVLDEIETTRY